MIQGSEQLSSLGIAFVDVMRNLNTDMIKGYADSFPQKGALEIIISSHTQNL